MGNAVHKDAHEAFRQVCYQFGVEKLAGMMGVPAGTLYNKCNVNETSHHKPTLADCIVVSHLTGDNRVLYAFAHTMGEVCYSLPDLSSLNTDTLLMHLTSIQMRNGSFNLEIHAALDNDNRIDAREYSRIEHEAHEHIAMILESLVRMREMAGVR